MSSSKASAKSAPRASSDKPQALLRSAPAASMSSTAITQVSPSEVTDRSLIPGTM